jgi:predicted RNA-binding protein YlxR (DUF448 family)
MIAIVRGYLMKPKKLPERMCAGCQARKTKKELIRVVRSPEGEISLDLTGKKSGRGAYICPASQCLKQARKARRLERSFSCPIPDEVYDRLEEELEKGEG